MNFLRKTVRSGSRSALTRRRGADARAAVSCEPLEQRALLSGDGPLVISEFMADNSTGLRDEDLEYSDWIEINNPTAAAVSLDGYFLTDDAADPDKWRLPAISLAPNGYQVVFASGKDRLAGARPHTNFKLDAGGEYLALVRPDGVTISDAYVPKYPGQIENVSYGVFNGSERYFTTPTPGASNNAGNTGVVSDTVFSVDRGFFDQPFSVMIATQTPGAQIRYTTNGTKPTATTGTVYGGPITVDHTTVLRAAAFKPGLVPSDTDTQTYLFLDDVVRQTAESTLAGGFPATWGSNTPDYGMDSDVIGQTGPDLFGGEYAATIKDDLKAIPTMSIVLPVADMFGPNGIYSNSTARGDQWERATSVELIDPAGNGADEFQVNAGIQIQGGAFRGDGLSKKHSFRLLFKDKWGVSKLEFPLFGNDSADRFDSVTLRADANDGWQWDGAGGEALYSRDMWSRATQRAMGHPASDGAHVHLYVNGVYWGLYNPSERPDAAFAETYIGGDKADWDVLNQDGVTDGNATGWNTMLSLAQAVQDGATEADRSAAYQRIQGNNPDGTDNPAYQDYLDVDSLIDYMLLNIFTGNADWPHRNWYAGRLRADDGIGTDSTGFKFFSWDAESALDLWADVNSNRTGVTEGPAQPYARLRASADFRARFADRVQLHMFGNGALSTAANKARMAEVTAQIDRAIVAESARWGDQHRNPPYTRADWAADRDSLLRAGGYFDQRWGVVLGQLRAAGLYGALDAPVLGTPGGTVPPNSPVQIGGTTGTVYYTLDGSDPRLPSGGVNPAARSAATAGATLVARGSIWKYLDDGSDQGTDWRASAFDDSGWAAGPGQLGYGDGDEATVVGFGPNPGSKYITTYFRRSFNVDDPSRFGPMKLRVLRDDGAVVYLNGQEVGRSNMPDGDVGSQTAASANGEDVQVEFDLDSSLLRAGANVFAVEIHQSNGGSSDISFDLELVAPAPPATVVIPAGTTTLRARARDAAGNWSALSEAVYRTDAVAATAANLAVTEVNYNPHAPEPALGEPATAGRGDFEFIELMNTGSQRVTLGGVEFWLGVKLKFPAGAYLDPGERAVVVKNEAAFRSRYGPAARVLGTFGGSLGNDGQLTILKDARGAVIDSFRYGDGGDWPNRADGGGATLEIINPSGDYNDPHNWRSSREYGGTPGAAGTGPLPGVVINEVLSDSSAPLTDLVELYNPTPQAVDVGGWYLSDSAADYRKFRIPDGTLIDPGGYLVYDEAQLGFSFDSDGDDVWLMQADRATRRLTRFVDRVEFGAADGGEPWGRWPSGDAGAGLYPLRDPSPGRANSEPRVGPVVINEIMYSPAAGAQEFIELYNVTAADVSLAGWRFDAGIDFTFPAGTVIPANGYLLVVGGDPAAFRTANNVPASVPVVGPFTIGGFLNVLDNAGERLVLARPGEAAPGGAAPEYEIDRVRYGAVAPWPVLPPAGGASLERRNPSSWADTAANWGASVPGGTPGRFNSVAAPSYAVVGRQVFYDGSAFDGGVAGPGPADDGAIATDKRALLPGGAATFANVITYSRGINGVMIDITAGLPQTVLAGIAATVGLKFGAGGDPAAWADAPRPALVGIRPGAGVNGSDRITLTWPNGSLKNGWLRVSVSAPAQYGLTPDVFYYGSLSGDTGDGDTLFRVNATDLAGVKRALNGSSSITGRFDIDRDGRVSALDLAGVKQSINRVLARLIVPVAGPAPAAAAVATPFATGGAGGGSVRRVWDEWQAALL